MDNAHALVIGIDVGYERVSKLPPTRDAVAIAEVLANPEEGGYAPENIVTLTNEAATKHGILDALATMVERSDRNSTVFLYFSGHGGRITDGPARGQYLIPADADPSTEAALAASSISDHSLTEALDQLSARKVIVLLDACHAGGIGTLKTAQVASVKAGLSEAFYDRLSAGHGRVIFASCMDTEYSLIFPTDEQSLFTKHLIGGIRGGIPSEDGFVRVFDLFEYLQPRITEEAAPHNQHPVFKAHLQENFPVALRIGGEKAAVPKDDDGYRFDAYISYFDHEPDSTWVWDFLVPSLKGSGLRVAVSGNSGDPAVPIIVNAERGIAQAKRTVAVLSDGYLADQWAEFENVVAQTAGLESRGWRLIPISFGSFDLSRLPYRLKILNPLQLYDSRDDGLGDRINGQRVDRAMERLVSALAGPVPKMR